MGTWPESLPCTHSSTQEATCPTEARERRDLPRAACPSYVLCSELHSPPRQRKEVSRASTCREGRSSQSADTQVSVCVPGAELSTDTWPPLLLPSP